jgi:hypothetical protein
MHARMPGFSLEKTLDDVAREIQKMGYDRVRLYTLTPDRQMMICQAQAGMTNGFTGSIRDASCCWPTTKTAARN